MLKNFILIGRAEAVSFLVLLLIAMPLKYGLDMPHAVKYVGWIHGVLFVAYVGYLLFLGITRRWKLTDMALMFGAAFFPAGPFLMENRVLAKYAES